MNGAEQLLLTEQQIGRNVSTAELLAKILSIFDRAGK